MKKSKITKEDIAAQEQAALAYQQAYVRPATPQFAFQVMNNCYPVPSATPSDRISLTPAQFRVDLLTRQVNMGEADAEQAFSPYPYQK